LGEKQIPEDAYCGIHTARSLENFQISSLRFQKKFCWALAAIKLSCAKANLELNLLENKKAEAIAAACTEIMNGKLLENLSLDIFQAGSGTSTNMNFNEVIANRALEILGEKKGSKNIIHPNDDVNMGQSTNDIIPTTMRISSYALLLELIPVAENLHKTLVKKAEEFKRIIKSGRTHLQDAVPITLGQEFRAYADAIGKDIQRLRDNQKFVRKLSIGGNAVGTGLNTYPEFQEIAVKYINEVTALVFEVSEDKIEGVQFLTDITALSSSLKILSLDLNKISNDLRLLSSGPNTGLKEINLPAVEPGSSIMPGKINPSVAEALNMVCYKVQGNDLAISTACQAAQFELNTNMPLIAYSIIESLEILKNAIRTFDEKCVSGITANEEICREYFESSMGIATALNPYLGYDKVAEIVKEAVRQKKTIREIILERGYMAKKLVDELLDPETITRPNLKRK
jgi:aspartate ammonia-lyase